jgi:hypothetical protein
MHANERYDDYNVGKFRTHGPPTPTPCPNLFGGARYHFKQMNEYFRIVANATRPLHHERIQPIPLRTAYAAVDRAI